jgi:hypothetical protein
VPIGNPPIIDRVSSMNDTLCDASGVRHMRIHPDCPLLIRDMREQGVDEDGKPDESERSMGHSGAACGYAVHYLRRAGGRVESSEVGGRFIFGTPNVPMG